MATLPSLLDDDTEYRKAYQAFMDSSIEHESVKIFLNGILPDILASFAEGKTTLNVMGVGSGSGEIDLEILHQIRLQHPEVKVDNEVVEPSSDMLNKYKEIVRKMPGLDHVTFKWNNMKTSEFQKNWKERNPEKKMDFIHMIQMLYYVEDPCAAVSFFQSLLQKNGKLLVIVDAGDSGFTKLWDTYGTNFSKCQLNQGLTMPEITRYLDARGISYQTYKIPSCIDITKCFMLGDETGELLLDYLTEVREFSKNASPELREGVMAQIRGPECSQETDGRILFDSTLEALVIDP